MNSRKLSEEYNMDVEKIGRLYNIEPKIILYILRKFFSLEEFTKQYINSLGSENPIYATKLLGSKIKTVQYFELTSSNIVGKNSEYGKLFRDILDTKYGFTIEGPIEPFLKLAIENEFIHDARSYDVLMSYYGIDRPKLTFDEISVRYGVTKQRIGQIKDGAIEILRANPEVQNLINKVLKEDYSRKAIAEVAELSDIFTRENSQLENYKKRDKFLVLYYIQELEAIHLGEECFRELKQIQEKTEESILDPNERKHMLKRIDYKKKKIVAKNTPEVIDIFEEKIKGMQISTSQYVEELINEIEHSGLPGTMIESLLEKVSFTRESIKQSIIHNFQHKISETVLDMKMQTSFEDAELPKGLYLMLKRMNILTLENLMELSRKDIELMKGVGVGKARKINDIIESFGYEIPEDITTSFKEYNANLMEIDSNTLNADEIAHEIMESKLVDEDKSDLLDELYKNAIAKLKVLYAEYNRRKAEYEQMAEELFDQTLKTKKEIEIDQERGHKAMEKAAAITETQKLILARISNLEGTNLDDEQGER